MTEMVERVADVIRRWAANGSEWADDAARDAIEAMREPTEAMCLAGSNAETTYSELGGDTCSIDFGTAADAWKLMIDTALKDAK